MQAVVYKQPEVIPTSGLEDVFLLSSPPSYNQNLIQSDCGNSKDCNDGYQCVEHAQKGDRTEQLHFSSHEELTSAYRFKKFRY